MHVSARSTVPLGYPSDQSPKLEKAATLFSSLSNAVRLAVMLRLIAREWSVNELAADLKISQSALSQHLGRLRQAGAVHSRREGQMVFYHCSDEIIIRLLVNAGIVRSIV